MSLIDVVILIVLLSVITVIIYFNIWKNRKKPCKGCPYAKQCDKNNCK